jgi:hypothetical protein
MQRRGLLQALNVTLRIATEKKDAMKSMFDPLTQKHTRTHTW